MTDDTSSTPPPLSGSRPSESPGARRPSARPETSIAGTPEAMGMEQETGGSEPPPSRAYKRALSRIEARTSTLEAQVLALQERVTEINGLLRAQRQRGLWLRVFLLLAALAAFFVIRSMKGGG